MMPPGLRMSDAILATTLQEATPSDDDSRTRVRIACWMRAACSGGSPSGSTRYPSSMPICSTTGASSPTSPQTRRDQSRYSRWSGRTKTTSGQRRSASALDMALRMPCLRAS